MKGLEDFGFWYYLKVSKKTNRQERKERQAIRVLESYCVWDGRDN